MVTDAAADKPEPSEPVARVLFGVRKADLYLAIERCGDQFVLVHELAIGSQVIRAAVQMSPGAAKEMSDAIAKELRNDELAAKLAADALAQAADGAPK